MDQVKSIRTKFDDPMKGVRGSIDILMISETKQDVNFATSHIFDKWLYLSMQKAERTYHQR